jgi:hypothetical protein
VQCDSCGEAMVREAVAVEILIAGRRSSIDQPGWYCWSCKLGAHAASDPALADPVLNNDALAALLGTRRQLRHGKSAQARRG